jgi:uncharacterized integral membrane protein
MPAVKDVQSTNRQTDEPSPFTEGRTDAIHQSSAEAERRHRQRQTAAAAIGALVAVFALINLGDVKVHWLIATGETPLIVVIVLAFLLGIAADRLLLARARRKRRAES